MKLPAEFVRNVGHYFENGPEWLAALPARLSDLASRWALTVGEPFALSVNWVGAARWQDRAVVLKLSPSPEALAREVAALRAYAAAELPVPEVLRHEPGAYLMDRLDGPSQWPAAGWSAEHDAAGAHTAGALLARLRGVMPANPQPFEPLNMVAAALHEPAPGVPPALLDRARSLLGELSAGQPQQLLHGDLHHGNLLWHGNHLHLTDPHGYWGPFGFEVGAWLRNPSPGFEARADLGPLLARRVAIFAEHTGLSQAEVRGWGCVQATLSACWDAGEGRPTPPAVAVGLALA